MPDVGTTDTSSYLKPQAPKSPFEIAGQVMDVRQRQQALMQAQMDMQRQRLGEIGNAAASLLPLGDKMTMDHVRDKVYGLVDVGIVDPKTASAFMQQAQAQSGGSGAGLFRFAQQTAQSAIGAAKAMEQQMGQLTMVDTGPGITPVRVPGMLGPNGRAQPVYGSGPEMQKGLTPGEYESGVPVVNDRGQMEREKLGNLARPQPTNPLAIPLQQGQKRLDSAFQQLPAAGPAKAAPPASLPGQGPVPPKVRSEVEGQGAPGQGTPVQAPQSGRPVLGLSPENMKEIEAQGETAVSVKQEAEAAMLRQRGLDDIRESLKHIKTGGGAELRSNVAQVLQAVGAPKELVDRVGNNSLPWGQVFDKQAMDVVTQTINSRFGGKMPSNLEFGTFMNRFPNINTDKQAVSHMVDYFATLNQMSIDKAKAYAAYKDKGFDMRRFTTGVWIPYVTSPRSPYRMPGEERTK